MDEQNQPSDPSNHPLTQRTYQNIIDQQISKAMAEGMFDQLAGQGKPLQFDDDTLVPEEDRLGHRMLKSHGFALPWIEARRDIDQMQEEIVAWLQKANQDWPYCNAARQQTLRAEYLRKLENLQRMITSYNLRTPPTVGQLPGLRMEDELAKLGG